MGRERGTAQEAVQSVGARLSMDAEELCRNLKSEEISSDETIVQTDTNSNSRSHFKADPPAISELECDW